MSDEQPPADLDHPVEAQLSLDRLVPEEDAAPTAASTEQHDALEESRPDTAAINPDAPAVSSQDHPATNVPDDLTTDSPTHTADGGLSEVEDAVDVGMPPVDEQPDTGRSIAEPTDNPETADLESAELETNDLKTGDVKTGDLDEAPDEPEPDVSGDDDRGVESEQLAEAVRPVETVAAAATSAPPALPTSWPDPVPVAVRAPEPGRFAGVQITPSIVVLSVLVTLSFLMFVTIEPTPRWLLIFTALVALLGTDGALRQAWPRFFSRQTEPADTSPYLFLPALAAIAWPLLIEHNVRGYLVLPAALLAGVAYVAMLSAQVSSVKIDSPAYPLARLVSTAAVYISAFSLFSLSYVLDVELLAAVVAMGVLAAMLGVELYREGQVDPVETLVFAGVTGVILGEARWVMHYMPVGGYLGGLTLLLTFFLATGLLHSHLTRRLSNVIALEYAGIAAAGIVLVAIGVQAGLG